MLPENIAVTDFCFSSMMSPSGYLAKQPELRAMADSVFLWLIYGGEGLL
ncbi:MAG: hypothetical protein J6M38_08855 [Lentisphaeria bacterium]|nr:hypothetical protein [Lentisphaeria bacterium]